MKRNIAMAWARYLEAPRRKQAVETLDIGNGARCCLGHLCAMLKVPRVKWEGEFVYDGEPYVLSPKIMKQVGMKSQIGVYSYKISEGKTFADKSLAQDNDDGVSLKEIAKIIRKHWKEL